MNEPIGPVDVADEIALRLKGLGFPIDMETEGDADILQALNQVVILRKEDWTALFSILDYLLDHRAAINSELDLEVVSDEQAERLANLLNENPIKE